MGLILHAQGLQSEGPMGFLRTEQAVVHAAETGRLGGQRCQNPAVAPKQVFWASVLLGEPVDDPDNPAERWAATRKIPEDAGPEWLHEALFRLEPR